MQFVRHDFSFEEEVPSKDPARITKGNLECIPRYPASVFWWDFMLAFYQMKFYFIYRFLCMCPEEISKHNMALIVLVRGLREHACW